MSSARLPSHFNGNILMLKTNLLLPSSGLGVKAEIFYRSGLLNLKDVKCFRHFCKIAKWDY